MADLTVEDYRMIEYFWGEHGDITAWASWDERKSLFEEKHPELVHAAEQLVIAERTLSAIVKVVCSENT